MKEVGKANKFLDSVRDFYSTVQRLEYTSGLGS